MGAVLAACGSLLIALVPSVESLIVSLLLIGYGRLQARRGLKGLLSRDGATPLSTFPGAAGAPLLGAVVALVGQAAGSRPMFQIGLALTALGMIALPVLLAQRGKASRRLAPAHDALFRLGWPVVSGGVGLLLFVVALAEVEAGVVWPLAWSLLAAAEVGVAVALAFAMLDLNLAAQRARAVATGQVVGGMLAACGLLFVAVTTGAGVTVVGLVSVFAGVVVLVFSARAAVVSGAALAAIGLLASLLASEAHADEATVNVCLAAAAAGCAWTISASLQAAAKSKSGVTNVVLLSLGLVGSGLLVLAALAGVFGGLHGWGRSLPLALLAFGFVGFARQAQFEDVEAPALSERIDAFAYQLEMGLVVGSLLVMTLTYFLKIVHRQVTAKINNFDELVLTFSGVAEADATPEFLVAVHDIYTPIALTILSVILIMLAFRTRHGVLHPHHEGSRPWSRWFGYSLVVAFLIYAGSRLVGIIRPRELCIAAVAIMAWLALGRAATARAWGGLTGAVLGTAAFVWYFLDEAPVGYIFGDKLSIFLLMYVGFIGASMATRDGKHIRIDFIRKKVPLTKLNLYNAISGLVAVSFTLFLGALSLDYLTGRLKYGGHVEGLVIADYLVALPIVVGVLVIALRFGKAALDDLGAHLRGEIAKPVEMELL